jgi:3-methyladenine DNA glycosylase AlkD
LERIEKAKSWDQIDELSSHILGKILLDRIELMSEIKKLSESKNPWLRRASIVSTCQLIGKNKIELTLRLAEKLVYDNDIYVQKGAGWMLREAGKRNRLAVREFILSRLDMQPNAFSYATEKMTELRKIRKEYLEKIKKEKQENENKS